MTSSFVIQEADQNHGKISLNLRLNISIVNALWVILVGEQLDLEDPTLAEILKVSGFALALQITIFALN